MNTIDDHIKHEKFGTILGIAPGNVPVYSSNYDSIDKENLQTRHSYRNYVDGIFMGYKWQCVEFARRWLYHNKGYIFDDIAMAYDIFYLKQVRLIKNNMALPLHSFKNGSKRPPIPGSMLVWDEGGKFERTGHVAIVTEVYPDKIRFIEQNVEDRFWKNGQTFSRELSTKLDNFGGYWVACSYINSNFLGWVIQTEDNTHAEQFPELDKKLLNLKARHLKNNGQADKQWLNIANPDEAAYVEANSGHTMALSKDNQYKYFCISKTAQKEVKHATNELHAMFIHATDHVLQNPDLLEKFCIPKSLLPKLYKSWNNRRNQMITGRFDFTVSEKGIKVYEYNSDSASTYMECGKIQDMWAKHFGCKDGRSSGDRLYGRLVEAWKESEVTGLLHIMQDHDLEENYHALFMKSAIEEAGIECKILKGVEGLSFDSNGKIVDMDKIPIQWIWKTWAWETAIDQIRMEMDINSSRQTPTLSDVLLRDDITVFEPFWAIIPSNKAILPILWKLYPNHPYLLNSSFTLTDELIKTGYVVKPIVGRSGANISIYEKNESLIAETDGKFRNKKQIFQEFFPLPKIDNNSVQLATFTVSGIYAGANIRIDPSPIVLSDSDLLALRIVEDSHLTSSDLS